MLVASLPGCFPATNQIDDQSSVQGRQIKNVAVRVKKPFKRELGPTYYGFPEGIYKIDFEDKFCVYFLAPGSVTSSSGTLFKGGVCIQKSDSVLQDWVLMSRSGEIARFFWQGPIAADYEYIDARTGAPIRLQDLPLVETPQKAP